MTHERDQAHTLGHAKAAELDATIAPGRAARTDHLIGPNGPRPSGLLMRKASGTVAPDAEQAVGAASSSSGERLPDDLRGRFEQSLGTDLGDVRIHTGAASADATAAVGARAYATGNDIHFAAGEYQPHSPSGQELIAHEVAHTVQQRGGSTTRQHKLAVSSAGDHAEVEADRAASAMVSGAAFSVEGASNGLYRKSLAPKVAGGMSLTNNALKFSVSAKCEPIEFKWGYIKFVPNSGVSIDATMTEKNPPKEGENEDPSHNPEAHRAEAESGGTEALKAEIKEGLTEKSAEGEGEELGWEMPEIENGTGGAGGISITYKFSAFGKPVSCKISALELAKGKEPEFAQMSIDVELARKQKQLWQNDMFKLEAGASISIALDIKPNWEKILPKLAQQASTKLRPFLSELVETTLGESVMDAGFLAIGLSVLGVLAIGADVLSDLATAEKAAYDQLHGFGDGFSSALGVELRRSQDASAFLAGAAQAHAAMNAQIAKVNANPLFAAYGFGQDELEHAIKKAAAPHVEELRLKAEAAAQNAIFSKAAKAFFDKEMASKFATYSDAALLATRLKVLDAIPPRKD